MLNRDIVFDYFRGYESEQFAFYRIPKLLFTDDYFKELSSDAKILYGLMLDRMSLSIKNRWLDDEDKVYIIFTLEQVMEYLNCGKDKGVKILAELDTEKGIGLIERIKQGLGKPTLIYVKSFIIKDNPDKLKTSDKPKSEIRKAKRAEVLTSKKPKSELLKSRSQEFQETEVLTSEKSNSRLLEERIQKVGKTDTNNINNNYNDFSDNNLINHSNRGQGFVQEKKIDVMDEIGIYTDIVKTNIDYDILIHDSGIDAGEYIDEIVDIMVETISIKRENVIIGGVEYPYQLVKSKLLKVDFSHMQYVLGCLHKNTTKVHNVRAYLLKCIYNAPSTINNYYRAEVNHDLYGND